MAISSKFKNVNLFICIIVALIVGISGEDDPFKCQLERNCRGSTTDKYGTQCSGWFGKGVSVMYEEHANNKCIKTQCCNETAIPDAQYDAFKFGAGCSASPCVSKMTNYCSTLSYRDGKNKIIGSTVESVYKEECKLENGQNGFIHLCCQRGHVEQFLSIGYAAEKDEFPYFVRTASGCGATIYNEKYIITAAHCLYGDDGPAKAKDQYVLLGVNIESNQKNRYNAAEIIIHPDYSHSKENKKKFEGEPYTNDIALIKLKDKIKFGRNIKPIPIAPLDFNPLDYGNDQVIIGGWGESENFRYADLLRKGYATYHTPEDCKRWGSPSNDPKYYTDYTICLGGLGEQESESGEEVASDNDTGAGDSGGPAICKDKNGFPVLCGVVSYGPDISYCQIKAKEDSGNCAAGTYAKVSYYRPWIIKHAGKQPKDLFKQKYTEVSSDENSYPQLANILENDQLGNCDGALIGKKYVLTAAQCVYTNKGKQKQKSSLSVMFTVNGEHSVHTVAKIHSQSWQAKFKIANNFAWFRNPGNLGNQRYLKRDYYEYDIAILELEEEVEGVEPLRLPKSDLKLLGSGTEISTLLTSKENLKSTRTVKFLQKSDCSKRYASFDVDLSESGTYKDKESQKNWNWLKKNRKDVKISEREFCYVEKYSGGNLCDRSLGGPIISSLRGQNVIIGIQTFRFCGSSFPMLGVDVLHFEKEIRSIIEQNDDQEQLQEEL
jgi:secreted trypsin-like serine protease